MGQKYISDNKSGVEINDESNFSRIRKLYAKSKLFKNLSFYVSGNMESPLVESTDYNLIQSDSGFYLNPIRGQQYNLTDATEINDANYRFTIGFKKMSKFKYNEDDRYNSGNSISKSAPISAKNGLEYSASYSLIRNRGKEYSATKLNMRYLGNRFVTKAEYIDYQDVKLKLYGVDFRARFKLKKLNFTTGVVHRVHPAYGINPFEDDFGGINDLTELATAIGYQADSYLYIDPNGDNALDLGDSFDFQFFDENGELVAGSVAEFFDVYFEEIVTDYNYSKLKYKGNQLELSAIFGLSYYTYKNDFWFHGWLDVLPFHLGLSDYSFDYDAVEDSKILPSQFDWDLGLVFGTKLSKNVGIYLEGKHQRFWNIYNYNLQLGFKIKMGSDYK
tara:strand:+ start:106 stop:1272 length:1167 start_codon:yes stop_codon:yes gene_type:complete